MSIDWSQVVAWFGDIPNFHDAEVLSVCLRRAPNASIIEIDTWITRDDVDANGFLKRDSAATVRFTLNDIADSSVGGWNHQNALLALEVDEVGAGTRLTFVASNGLQGSIVAGEVTVSITKR